MRRLVLTLTALIVGGFVYQAWPAHATGTIERFPITAGNDDAWQRGTTALQYGQDATNSIVYLGRSDDPTLRMSGGFRFHTDIPANTTIVDAYLQGFNNFGQSTTVVIYGDTTAGHPDFASSNPTILSRSHTTSNVIWYGTVPLNQNYTVNFAKVLNELDRRADWDGTVTLLVLGQGGSDNQSIDIRSFEHPTGPAAILEVQT